MQVYLTIFCLCGVFFFVNAQNEPFSEPQEINSWPDEPYRIQHPFEIQFGPEKKLWVSSKSGIIIVVDPKTGNRNILADLGDLILFKRFFNNQGVLQRVAQDGLLGVALHPELKKGTGNDWVYVAYIYDNDPGNGIERKGRIVQYRYAEAAGEAFLVTPTTLIEGLPGSNDHNAGRLIFGGDQKLYYSIGDQGANQGSNRCNPNRSQDLPTQTEVNEQNWETYQGKILRLNLDGSIPNDNPELNGVQSHIYSYGHRNPQGLVFQRNSEGIIFENANLYSNEHGHRTDDEVNQIIAGKNYGWPLVSGFIDDAGYSYFNWSSSSDCPSSSSNACNPPSDASEFIESNFTASNFMPPMQSFYVEENPSCGNFLDFSTIAPSSMDFYYHENAIPGWKNSLLITTLKRGLILRLPLNDEGDQIVGDPIPYFQDLNRYRDLAISPDGLSIYVLTDSLGSTSFAAGDNNQVLKNRGGIMVINYEGTVSSNRAPFGNNHKVSIFPNPSKEVVQINLDPTIELFGNQFRLINLMGQQLLMGPLNQGNFSLDIGEYSSGLYLFQLVDTNGAIWFQQKIMKN